MVSGRAEAPEPPEGARDRPLDTTANRGIRPDPGADTDDTEDEYEGYEPLPLAPPEDSDLRMWNSDLMSPATSDDEDYDNNAEPMEMEENAEPAQSTSSVPFIETVDREVTREVWTTPREVNIEMDPAKAQEVMSAMANFSLPPSSFPEWAQCVSEEEWRQQLAKRLNTTQENR